MDGTSAFSGEKLSSKQLTRRQFARRIAGIGVGALAYGGLSSMLGGCGGAAASTYQASASLLTETSGPLKTAARQGNILFGAATEPDRLSVDPDFAAQITTHCDLLVPENQLKWMYVEPQPGAFVSSQGDYLLDFCTSNAMSLRGHCLVWHNQLPTWAGYGTAAEVQQQLVSHVKGVMAHYAGRLHSWDVVNEALNPYDGRSDCLRNSMWLQALGPGYIDLAYQTAAEADPTAVLVYNDYGMEQGTSDADARRAGALKLLTGMKQRGVPIHALGLQSHLNEEGCSPSKLTIFLKKVQDLGLKIFITELDVSDKMFPADTQTRDLDVAGIYEQYLKTVLAIPAVTTVLTWGLSDRYTWLSYTEPRTDGQPVRPLPLDSSLKPKAALNAMTNAFVGRY